MIDCIFTIDYEIYGNGKGTLKELIYEPAKKLLNIFDQDGTKLVFFIEVAELEKIESSRTDSAINDVKNQILDLYNNGHEIALHLHPQWSKGEYIGGNWELNNEEYNLCVLSEERIKEIINDSINYLRTVLKKPEFIPFSFRAGNWLFQPTQPTANVLAQRGIKVDSSVFKGGRQKKYFLDYRPSLINGYFWKFQDNINVTDFNGALMEIPIYSQMVFPWQMATKKRLGLQQKASSGIRIMGQKISRLRDFLRFRQPLKLDFCRMTIGELTGVMNKIIKADEHNPTSYKPIACIGHTKDLIDFETIEYFLSYLHQQGISVTTLKEAYFKTIALNQ